MSRRNQQIVVTEPAQEEGVLERTVRTYIVEVIAAVGAVLVIAYWQLTGAELISVAPALTGVFLLFLLGTYLDPMLTIWLRWEAVARDTGTVAAWTGVPDLLWVWRTSRGVSFCVSGLAIEPDDIFAVEDRVAKGFGYSAGLVEEKAGRYRTSRRRYHVHLSKLDGLLEAFPLPEGKPYSANDTAIILGRSKNLDTISWHLLESAGHFILQGQTRSGKSVLMYSIFSQMASMVDVTVRGIDPTGILAKPWDPDHWVTGTEDMCRAADLLEAEVAEMDTRNRFLSQAGLDKISEVSVHTPLRVIVLEEFPGIMKAAAAEDTKLARKPAEKAAPRITAALGRLVAEGAKTGIRVMLLAQRASSQVMDTDSRGNFSIRVTLRVDDAEAIKMLHAGLDPSWHKAIKKYKNGVGVVDIPGEDSQKFKAVYIGSQEYDRYLTSVWVGEDLALARAGVLADIR
ncbi:FtsK/SpoIIIE domain-containing protein [Tsukamurella tyrosinosolvens]|uniref:FtsK/SpoIIIE domain-containing protein n=1 Tax=Tsukamurella tyrosinosolvens TaxID=57704 RepID=UPI002DD425EE|nr:FtsK/SpoIIIE domain-containing protein [Tsukamurella tyrosinosolvens]MEC4612906.1 FtsK/SpoIIIE domain-containing protein [Tsukamurella tyrosinosolvens]